MEASSVSGLPLLLGLAGLSFMGSWHCAVMCGPMAIALGRKKNLFFYHLGRCVSYVGAGAFCGQLGFSLFKVESPSARIAVGLFLSAFFILPLIPALNLQGWGHVVFGKIARHRPGLFLFGVATVFLPCGWLWTYLAAAAASGSPWAGALITGILWLSSLPALSLLPRYFSHLKGLGPRRTRVVHAVTVAAGIYAVWSHILLS